MVAFIVAMLVLPGDTPDEKLARAALRTGYATEDFFWSLGRFSTPPLERLRVGRVVIQGNTKTPTEFIYDRLCLGPGVRLYYLDRPLLEFQLASLGLFEYRPRVQYRDDPNNPGSVFKDVVVTVNERGAK
jgi:hypothetical protein